MRRLLAALALAGLLTACDPRAPIVSLKACRVDESTARVSWWIVERDHQVILSASGGAPYQALPVDTSEMEARITGDTLTVEVFIDGQSEVRTLWATVPCARAADD